VKVLVKFKDEREYCVTKCDVVCEAVPCCHTQPCNNGSCCPAPAPSCTTGTVTPVEVVPNPKQ
jgi:hypothetical protein